MALVFRRAAIADLPEIARIYNQAVEERTATADIEPRSLEERREWFKQFDDRYPIWVAEAGGTLVGYCALFSYSPKEGYRFAAENSLYVAREARGRGHGRELLAHTVAQARALGFHYLLARIFSHNDVSIRLHAELGFKPLGMQKRIVEMKGQWYDVALMDLAL